MADKEEIQPEPVVISKKRDRKEYQKEQYQKRKAARNVEESDTETELDARAPKGVSKAIKPHICDINGYLLPPFTDSTWFSSLDALPQIQNFRGKWKSVVQLQKMQRPPFYFEQTMGRAQSEG